MWTFYSLLQSIPARPNRTVLSVPGIVPFYKSGTPLQPFSQQCTGRGVSLLPEMRPAPPRPARPGVSRPARRRWPPPRPHGLRRRLPQHRLQPVPTEHVAAFSSLHPSPLLPTPPPSAIKLTSQKPGQPSRPMGARVIYSSELKVRSLPSNSGQRIP